MMLKPGKYNTNNFQTVFKSWKRHYSRSILDQVNLSFQWIFPLQCFCKEMKILSWPTLPH